MSGSGLPPRRIFRALFARRVGATGTATVVPVGTGPADRPSFGSLAVQAADIPRFGPLAVEAADIPRFGPLRIEWPEMPAFGPLEIGPPDIPGFGPLEIHPPDANAAVARLSGMHFEYDRVFLLPSAVPGLGKIRRFYEENPGRQILVVGHADQDGDAAHNLQLSRWRAEVVAAYLADDDAVWMQWFVGARWYYREYQYMLHEVKDADGKPFYELPYTRTNDVKTLLSFKKFQAHNNAVFHPHDPVRYPRLPLDGDPHREVTRRALVRAYMDLDGTTRPKNLVVKLHGCGAHHLVTEARDPESLAKNRRVEIYLFDGKIDPPVPADCPRPKGCDAYAKWVATVREEIDISDRPGEETPVTAELVAYPYDDDPATGRAEVAIGEGASLALHWRIRGAFTSARLVNEATGLASDVTKITAPGDPARGFLPCEPDSRHARGGAAVYRLEVTPPPAGAPPQVRITIQPAEGAIRPDLKDDLVHVHEVENAAALGFHLTRHRSAIESAGQAAAAASHETAASPVGYASGEKWRRGEDDEEMFRALRGAPATVPHIIEYVRPGDASLPSGVRFDPRFHFPARLASAPAKVRAAMASAARQCAGLGRDDTPKGRQNAYLDIVFPLEDHDFRRQFGGRTDEGASSCAIFVRGLLQLLGAGKPAANGKDRNYRARYRDGQAIVNLQEYARDWGALRVPGEVRGASVPRQGDIVLTVKPGHQHVWVIVEDTENVPGKQLHYETVEGGQSVDLNAPRPHAGDGSCMAIAAFVKDLRVDGGSYLVGSSAIGWWIDIAALAPAFTEPWVFPVRTGARR